MILLYCIYAEVWVRGTADVLQNAQEVARLMNCPLMSTSTELRDCLVAVPAERLVRTLYHFPHWGTRFPIPWAPVIESDFIPDSPEWLLRYGHITPVPLLAGNFFTEHMLLASYIYKHDELRAEFVNNFEETSKKYANSSKYYFLSEM